MFKFQFVSLIVLSVLLRAECFGSGPSKIVVDKNPVFLVAGQSNAVSPAQGHRPHFSRTGRVWLTDYYHGKNVRVPVQNNPMDGSICWIYLGDLLRRKVTFINIAQGSQSTTRWVDVHFTEQMLPALKRRKFDAVLWHQGESDWSEKIPYEVSYRNMKWLVERSREVQPGLPWIVAINSMKGAPKDAPIRRAQLKIIEEGLALRGPDTDELRKNLSWIEPGGAEFVGDGLRQHGRLWEKALQKVLQFKSE